MGRFLRCACSTSVLMSSCARFDDLRPFDSSLSKKKKDFSDFYSHLLLSTLHS